MSITWVIKTSDNIQRSNISRHYELKEIEGLQQVVSSGLDIVYSLLADFFEVYIYIYIFLLQKLEVNIIHFLWALYCFEITFFSDCYFYIIIAYVCIRMFLLCRTPG